MGGVILVLVLLLFSCRGQSPTVYTVTFDANGGTLSGEQSVTVIEGMAVSEPDDPTRSGCRFLGWYIQGTGTEYDFTLPVTSDLNLEARWSRINYTTYYTVTFEAKLPEGVSDVAVPDMPPSISIASGGTAEKPETDPELKNGDNTYIFLGWYSGDALFDFSEPITGNTTIEARWSQSYSNDTYGYHVFDAEGLMAWGSAAQDDLSLDCKLEDNIILPKVNEGESNWTAVGTSADDSQYKGTFNGDGKTITNLTVNNSSASYQGMFGYIGKDGSVKSLTLEYASISGKQYIGAIAGRNEGTIENCSINGEVKGSGPHVGGICGSNSGASTNLGTITDCYSTGSVSGYRNVGGVCGYNAFGTITACYSTGSVSGYRNVGGVCGSTASETITACYSTGSVSGSENVGGVCGYNAFGTITACYWSVPADSSVTVTAGIGDGNGTASQVDGNDVTWAEGDNSALSKMNEAISNQAEYEYDKNPDQDTSANMPLVLKESQT